MFLQGPRAGAPFPLPANSTGWATLLSKCRAIQKKEVVSAYVMVMVVVVAVAVVAVYSAF